MVGQAWRQRGGQRPTAHHHARARARQLVVEGVEQGPVPVAPLEQRVPVAEHLLERARLRVVAALDVEDRQVEKAAARGRRRPREQQVLGHEQHDADGPQRGRRAANQLSVEPHHPPGRTELHVEAPFEPPVQHLGPQVSPPVRRSPLDQNLRRASSGTSEAPPGSRRPRAHSSSPARCRRTAPRAARPAPTSAARDSATPPPPAPESSSRQAKMSLLQASSA